MDLKTFNELHRQGYISDDSLQKIESFEKNRLFSVHWQLKTLLYLGVTLLSSGLGILIYKNIDTIGHKVILVSIALISIGCFYYCNRKAAAFSLNKVESPDVLFDYILLLGCLTMLIFIAYWQYEYKIFGSRYGLATFIPMVILFFSAYAFDHLGVLSMAIANLAAWVGITITPLSILKDRLFELGLDYAGIILGAVLILAAVVSKKRNLKKHFEFTYNNFGTHIVFLSILTGMFTREYYMLWFVLLLGFSVFLYFRAMKNNSFYFLLITVLYFYVGLGYVVIRVIDGVGVYSTDSILLFLIYLIVSAIAMIRLLTFLNRKIKSNDRV